MPWECKTVEKQREEFVRAAKACGNFSALCREYEITRKTGYKWLARIEGGGGLQDRSRRPHNSPRQTPEELEALILAVRKENPGWGARRIHAVLEREGLQGLPCVKTVNNILHRNGCISQAESLKRKPFRCFERPRCNQLWQTDFKGEFRMADGQYCYPLTILDDHSRYSLGIAPRLNTTNVVIPVFTQVFSTFGLPDAILSDNGAQFAGFRQGYTSFEKWLMDLDVLPIHGRIRHPQTQGKIERFHRTLKDELLRHTQIADIDDAQRQLQAWRNKYNNHRPHEALGMRCPAEIYTPSLRPLPEKRPDFAYSGEYRVVKVNSWGYVRYAHWQVYLSETMCGEYIEFRPSEDGKTFLACYRNFRIAQFDCDSGARLNRSIFRL